MKKTLIALLLVAGFALFTSDAEAARRFRMFTPRSSSQQTYNQGYDYSPSYNSYYGQGYQSRPTLWDSFMEFERRKNAMIFGGW